METATATANPANPFDVINSRFDSLEKFLKETLQVNVTMDSIGLAATLSAQKEEPILIEEAAALLKKSVSTLYGWTQNNKIPFSKRGNTLYFFKSQLLQWVQEGYVKTCYEVEKEAGEYLLSKAREGERILLNRSKK